MLDLDNESKIWCFVCSLRCLIYKVHAAWRSSVILPLSFSFVKNFFQVFSDFFVLSFIGKPFSCKPFFASAVALASDLVIIPDTFSFVNTFFQFFRIFFFNPFFTMFSPTIYGLSSPNRNFFPIVLAEDGRLCYPYTK